MKQRSIRKRKKRNCGDKLRYKVASSIHRKGKDPAASILYKLINLLSQVFVLSPVSLVYGAPFSVHELLFRRKLEAASSTLDWDLGPTAYAMERGIEPVYYKTRKTSSLSPSWPRLVKDLSRRTTAEKARRMIEYRVPPAAVEWLRYQIEIEDWNTLRLLGRNKDEIAENALLEARKWEASKGAALEEIMDGPADHTHDLDPDNTPMKP